MVMVDSVSRAKLYLSKDTGLGYHDLASFLSRGSFDDDDRSHQ